MQERMHKAGTEVSGFPQRAKTESEWYAGAQTCVWMVEDNVAEVPFDRAHLLEAIFSPENLNKAYRSVIRNKGCGGIDRMSCDDLLPWLLAGEVLPKGTYYLPDRCIAANWLSLPGLTLL